MADDEVKLRYDGMVITIELMYKTQDAVEGWRLDERHGDYGVCDCKQSNESVRIPSVNSDALTICGNLNESMPMFGFISVDRELVLVTIDIDWAPVFIRCGCN